MQFPMLRSAGLPLPERVWAHGFLTGPGGTRFSKSSGVWIDLPDATARYGADALRYFLLREVPFDGDGAFSWERFDERSSGELTAVDTRSELVAALARLPPRQRAVLVLLRIGRGDAGYGRRHHLPIDRRPRGKRRTSVRR